MKKVINPKKYKRIAKILKIVLNIFYIFCVATAALAAITATILLFIPDSNFILSSLNGTFSFKPNDLIYFKLDPVVIAKTSIKYVVITILYAYTITAAVFSPLLKQTSLILETVETDKPFSIENASRLKIIGFTMIAGSFLIRLGVFLVYSVIISTFNLNNVELNYSADGGMLLIGFLMFILAGVFQYGSYLQGEYDSTV